MRRSDTTHDKAYVGSSGTGLESHSLRKRGRKLTPAETQFIASALMCDLSPSQVLALMACELQVAAAIVAEPHRRAEIEAAADGALREAVAAANNRRAA